MRIIDAVKSKDEIKQIAYLVEKHYVQFAATCGYLE